MRPNSLSLFLLLPVTVNPNRSLSSLLEMARASDSNTTRIALSEGVRSSLPGVPLSFLGRAPARGDELFDMGDHVRHVTRELVIREAQDHVPVDLQQPVPPPVGLEPQRVTVLRSVELDYAALRAPQQVQPHWGL